MLLYGAGSATNLQARYAGTDLALPTHRAKAISMAMVFTTFGAVAGPNLVTLTAASWIGLEFWIDQRDGGGGACNAPADSGENPRRDRCFDCAKRRFRRRIVGYGCRAIELHDAFPGRRFSVIAPDSRCALGSNENGRAGLNNRLRISPHNRHTTIARLALSSHAASPGAHYT